MIRPLRARHRAMTAVLAVLVPIGVVVAIGARVDVPASTWPTEPASELVGTDRSAIWGELAIETTVGRLSDGEVRIELTPQEDLQLPDVLVYWSTEPDLEGATLLGTLAGTRTRRFSLPAKSTERDGHLILYSLGHQEVVATAELAAVGG